VKSINSRIILTDPHGCHKTLIALIAKLPVGVPLTFAGDLIDRGPDSRKVIEFVKNGGHDCVLGNHEAMMLDELTFKPHRNKPGQEIVHINTYRGIWLPNGGENCLRSYLKDSTEQLESGEVAERRDHDIEALKEDMAWLRTLPYHILYEDVVNSKGQKLLVTHTTAAHVWGRCPPENLEFIESVTWERDSSPPEIEGIYNVFGHTPQYCGPTIKEQFACIDGGAYYNRTGYGKLFALQYPEMIIYEQENIE